MSAIDFNYKWEEFIIRAFGATGNPYLGLDAIVHLYIWAPSHSI